jgi:uncharacterized tellurite resistance protein B-like protein
MRTMELRELNPEQRLALVGLIEATVIADRRVSEEEEDVLAEVIEQLGDEQYRQLAAAADERFDSEDDLKTFLAKVQDPDARELIFGTVQELAMADVVGGEESPLLDWLGSTWNIETKVDELGADRDA